jgi:hypothetical protein
MALSRLKNIITSKTGRIIYVSSDDFDASDSIDNRGNSTLRPFKTIQRALLEVSRFSYRAGLNNDSFDSFTILLYPGEYIVDNRPGLSDYNTITALTDSSNFDITSVNNEFYKFNSVDGGAIVPRGCSLVGMDLRRTKIIPKYVPYPSYNEPSGAFANTDTLAAQLGVSYNNEPGLSAILRITGGCYFWQFTLRDGDTNGVYYREDDFSQLTAPNFSHHKLTGFEYASKTDLDLYYQKISKAFIQIPDTSGVISNDQIQTRVEENRIVGPISDVFAIGSIVRNGTTAIASTVDSAGQPTNHGFSVGVSVNISGADVDANGNLYNGSFIVTSASGNQFTYQMANAPAANASGTNIEVRVEIDTVDSASPYMFNLSLRSTWGMNAMLADGSRATGFKSMVVAQYTGISLQKDDRAFVRWNGSTYVNASYGDGAHLDGDAKYRKGWGHVHVKCSNDAFIQAVSVFAVGYERHFEAENGGDMSITNSNSNFGNTSLRSVGFKAAAFNKDNSGRITHILPPKSISHGTLTLSSVSGTFIPGQTVSQENNAGITGEIVSWDPATGALVVDQINGDFVGSGSTYRIYSGTDPANGGTNFGTPTTWVRAVKEVNVNWVSLDIQQTLTNGQVNPGTGVENRLYLYGYTTANGYSATAGPSTKLQGFNIGGRDQDRIYVPLYVDPNVVANTGLSAPGFKVYSSEIYTTGGYNPVQWDSQNGQWYIRTNDINIFGVLSGQSAQGQYYNAIQFSGISYVRRIPDTRTLTERTYRVRYVIPSTRTNPLPRTPITGFVVQPVSTGSTNPVYDNTFYIYDVEEYQKYEAGVSDGIYYMTLLKGNVTPSTPNFNNRKFSQQTTEVYPGFDRDNPKDDPAAATSIADNEIIGLVYATDGSGNKDNKLSITKECILDFLGEAKNNLNYDSVNEKLTFGGVDYFLKSKIGDTPENRSVPLNALSPYPGFDVELRRHSILRSGNHTFEYLGFGPGNYSTAFPSTQNRVLTKEEVRLSQSVKENGGVAFYSGLNSNGELYIGNNVVNPITGQVTSEDIATLNIVGEEGTQVDTFTEVTISDRLTVLGGDGNNLDSTFSGPVNFQNTINVQEGVFNNLLLNDTLGQNVRKFFLAQEDSSNIGFPDVDTTLAYNQGDVCYNISVGPGGNLGWVYINGNWVQWGITDIGLFNVLGSQLGLGRSPTAGYTLDVLGNVLVDGDLNVTGQVGFAGKYSSRSYVGSGTTGPFDIRDPASPLPAGYNHNVNTILVFLNGVCAKPQNDASTDPGDYTVVNNQVVFTSAIPTTTRIVIREFPI